MGNTMNKKMLISMLIVFLGCAGALTGYKVTTIVDEFDGYTTHLIVNLSRGVDNNGSMNALKEMEAKGVKLVYIEGLNDDKELPNSIEESELNISRYKNLEALIAKINADKTQQ